MSTYRTEDEQLEMIKKWFKQYRKIIFMAITLSLCILLGAKYWYVHLLKISSEASVAYEKLIFASAENDMPKVQAYANQLIREYKKTVYADVAHLMLAKVFILDRNYPRAQVSLEYVINNSKISALKQVAQLRNARVLLAEKLYDKAIVVLDGVQDKTYQPLVKQIKGDIFAADGKYKSALDVYREALQLEKAQGIENVELKMKINEVMSYV